MATLRELLVSVGFKVNESQFAQAEAKVQNIKSSMGKISKSGSDAAASAGRSMASIGDAAQRASAKAERAFQRSKNIVRENNLEISKTNDLLSTWGNRLNAIAAFAGITLSLGSIIGTVDEWKVISGQVKLVTKNQQEAAETEKELYKMAGRTRQSYAETANLFTIVARNASDMGKDTKDVLAFTEDVSRAMLIGGGSAESQKAALIQLGQALGSGVLRGEELNSVMEQAPRLSKAIAAGMGTTIGQLRKMAMEGKLTSEAVFNAIRSQSEQLKMEMGEIPWTVQQASTRMTDAMGNFFYEMEKRTGVVGNLAAGIAKVGDYIEKIDIDRFVTGFRLLAIYAAAFFVASKWGAITSGAEMFIGTLKAIRNSYLAATGAQVAFQSASAKSAVLGLLSMGKFLLIGAAITAVILILQDLYTWINGGESVIGEFFGSWQENIDKLSARWEQYKEEFGKAADQVIGWLINIYSEYNPIVRVAQEWLDIMKSIFGWIGDCMSKFDELQSKVTGFSIGDRLFGTDPNSGPLDTSKVMSDAGKLASSPSYRNYNNVGNQNNVINITAAPGSSPSEVADQVANKIPAPGGYDPGYDYPDVELID